MRKGVLRRPQRPDWVASGAYWRRRIGRWVLRIGAAGRRGHGWLIFRDGEIQGVGHADTVAEARAEAEREQLRALQEGKLDRSHRDAR